MAFDLDTWKAKVVERLQNWRSCMLHVGADSLLVSATQLL